MVVFISTHAPLRGIWQWVAVLFIALVITAIGLFGWWGHLVDWFGLLRVQINMAGYLFLSTWLFAVWAVTFFYFDRLTYMIFSTGQVRVRQAIGEGEKVYDVTNMNLELQPNVFFRHRVLGFYDAGDLIVRTGGAGPRSCAGRTCSASGRDCGRSSGWSRRARSSDAEPACEMPQTGVASSMVVSELSELKRRIQKPGISP